MREKSFHFLKISLQMRRFCDILIMIEDQDDKEKQNATFFLINETVWYSYEYESEVFICFRLPSGKN